MIRVQHTAIPQGLFNQFLNNQFAYVNQVAPLDDHRITTCDPNSGVSVQDAKKIKENIVRHLSAL